MKQKKSKLFNHFSNVILLIVSSILLSACNNSNKTDPVVVVDEPVNTSKVVAVFDPINGKIPSTNDLFFAGSVDGTLNIPLTSSATQAEKQLIDVLNSLDGFSTTAPMTFNFSANIASDSVSIANSIHIYEVSKNASGIITKVIKELNGTEMLAVVNNNVVILSPLKALKESSSYLVIVSNAIKDSEGVSIQGDAAYLLAKSTNALTGEFAALEGIRQLVNNQETIAATQGINKANIVLSWSFSTQSIRPVLENLAKNTQASTLQMSASGLNTKQVNSLLAGKADIYIGSLAIPYYLEAPTSTNPAAPLNSFWKGAGDSTLTRFNTTPIASSTQIIPVIMTVPNAASKSGGVAPAAGWPIVMFQHGITGDRSHALLIADALADAGFVVVGIDLPLHGIVDSSNPLNATTNTAFTNDHERSFGLDFMNNTTGETIADNIIDASGTYFINLSSLLTSRDNVRQAVADLLVLRKSLPAIDIVALDTQKIGFIGHSLGGIVGAVYLGVEPESTPASLVAAGGGIIRLLDESPTFGTIIQAGLAQAGLIKGSAEYDSFMAVAQTVLDSADPINFAAQAAANNAIHFIEIVGGNSALADQVIPNRVANAPLSGTEPLIEAMNLPAVSQTITNAAGVDGAVRFVAGNHASVLDPTSSLNTTIEIQTQLAAFQALSGTGIVISDPSVILQVTN